MLDSHFRRYGWIPDFAGMTDLCDNSFMRQLATTETIFL